MFDGDSLPSFLDTMEPGLPLAMILASIDVRSLTGHDRIVALRAQQRMASHFAAQVYDSMAAVTEVMDDDDPQWAEESAAAEIRAALRLTRRAADRELEYALDLQRRLPRVWGALASGALDVPRAKVIVRGTEHLSIAIARDVVERVIHDAPNLTTGQLAALLRRVCLETDPEDAERRYAEAVADRRVVMEPTVDGTANLLGIDLPPHRLAAGMRRINRMAMSLRSKDEPRTIDQLRADVLLDLLEGTGSAAGAGGVVDIHVGLATLAGLSEAPGELAGYGTVIADVARQVADAQMRSQWRVTVTDESTNDIVHVGTTRRRPTAGQRREVEARYKTCVFPGCRMPAAQCDLDHREPYGDGGPTAVANLAPTCRHDHVAVRHRTGWSYCRLPNGDHEWISRLGHRYVTSGRPP
jgi:hypothetical protein